MEDKYCVVKFPDSPEPDKLRIIGYEEYCLITGNAETVLKGTCEECEQYIKDAEVKPMTRGIKLSKTFKNYIYDQAYNWPVGKKSTDFSEDAFITNVYVTDDKLHNLNLLGKFFKNDDEEDAYAERHYVNIGNGTCSSSFCDMTSLHVVKSDKNILGDHKIPKDHILVIGRQYYSRGMPAMLAMEAPFDDYLAYIEDDLGVEPSDKPSEKIYKGYEE